MWNIDGVTITDMAAAGASTTYFDFNVFEEVQFTTGGLDSRQQTGGLGINLVSKRGANALHASGRAYFSNDELQGENVSSELKPLGFSAIGFNSLPNTAAMSVDRCERIASGSGPGCREPTSVRWRPTGFRMTAPSTPPRRGATRRRAEPRDSRFFIIALKS